MKKWLVATLLCITVIANAQKESPAVKYAGMITPQSMKDKLTILAGAEMEGRETGMPGEKKAAAFITPSPDWMSQLIVFVPVWLLYELSILVSARVYKQDKEEEDKEWDQDRRDMR